MSWRYVNLSIQVPDLPNNFNGRPRTAVVSSDVAGKYLLAVYGRVNEGHVIVALIEGTNWTKGTFTKPTAGANIPKAGGDPFLTETAAGQHVFYRTQDWHVVELLTAVGQAPKLAEISVPTATTYPATDPKVLHQIVWPGNVETLFVHFRDQLGTIHEFSASPGGAWEARPLFRVSYPTPVGDLANLRGTTTASGGVRRSIYFRSLDGHIHELEHDDAGWTHRDLTALTGAEAAAGDPAAYFEPTDDTKKHIVYVGKDSRVHELWCRYDGKNQWHHNNLHAAVGTGPAADQEVSITGYWQDMTQTQHVIFCDVIGGVQEFWLTNGKGWKYNNLSDAIRVNEFYPAINSRSGPIGSALAPNASVIKQHVCFRERRTNDLTIFYEWDVPAEPDLSSGPDWEPAGGGFGGDFDDPGEDEKITVWSSGDD